MPLEKNKWKRNKCIIKSGMVMMMIMIKYKIKININCTCKIINYIKHKNNNKKYNNHIQNLKITIIK